MEIYGNMSRINEYKKNPKDYIKIFVRITYGVLVLRYSEAILTVTYFTYIASLSITTYFLLSTLDAIKFMITYGAAFGTSVFMTINLGAIWMNRKEFREFFEWHEKIRIPYEIMDKNLIRRVEKLSKIIIVIVLINYALATISYILLAMCHKYFMKKYFFRAWTCNYLPGPCWIKILILHFFDGVTSYVMISSPTALIYFGMSGIFRLMLINEFVKNICTSKIPEEERYDSELFQKIVEQKLKICILLHDQAIQNAMKGASLIYGQMILFFLGAISLIGSLIFAILTTYTEKEYLVFSALNLFGVCSLLTGIFYVSVGQLMKNESENIWYFLIQNPWYLMNKKNLQMYSVFLRKSSKPIALSGDLIEINFLLFVKLFRAVYSVAALILQMSGMSPTLS